MVSEEEFQARQTSPAEHFTPQHDDCQQLLDSSPSSSGMSPGWHDVSHSHETKRMEIFFVFIFKVTHFFKNANLSYKNSVFCCYERMWYKSLIFDLLTLA